MIFRVWLVVSYDTKALYIHAKRRRKKRKGPIIKPEYRIELKGVNAKELGGVVQKEFGELLQDVGVKTVWQWLEWAKVGIDVWSGAGVVGDRGLISEFTGEDAAKLGGFSVNSPDCMVLDESVNNNWKNLAGDLNDMFQKRKPSRKRREVHQRHKFFFWKSQSREDSESNRSSTEDNGSNNRCKWWSHQLHEQWICVLGALCLIAVFWTILNIKSCLSMGNLLHFIVVVNCPFTEKYMFHVRPHNIFSAQLIGEHGNIVHTFM